MHDESVGQSRDGRTDMNGGDHHAAGRNNQDDRRRAVSVYNPYHCAARGRHQQGHPQEIPGVLGIEPICFLIGTRSLSISQEAMARVKQRKQKPALLAHLKSRVAL
jgi:hypothetical protein